MKQIIIIISSIVISYLFNAYAYSSFNPSVYPVEDKYLSCFGVLAILAIRSIVYDMILEDLTDKIKTLENEKDEK